MKMDQNRIQTLTTIALFLNLMTQCCLGFGGGVLDHHQTFTNIANSIDIESLPIGFCEAKSILAFSDSTNLLDKYKESLIAHPLSTKMITGATLAVCGDAIAQLQSEDDYDKRRAGSFAAFDAVYRAVQHLSFPAIVQECQGQYIGAVVASLPLLKVGVGNLGIENLSYYYGAMEQTLASQLGIVPFFYYPVFYAITAFVQGLNFDEAVCRARETFIPLMKRNLLFWIPVQFVQFGYIDESLQIPFLSVCGLCWTFIISLFAGNARKQIQDELEECVLYSTESGEVEECVGRANIQKEILEEEVEKDLILR